MTHWTPKPINLWAHAAFQDLLHSWGRLHNILRQQDAAEFLHHALNWLSPSWYGACWFPFWGLEDPDIAVHGGEKGEPFSPLRLSIPVEGASHKLADLIQKWHDMLGHQRVLISNLPGLCLHIARHEDDSGTMINHAQLLFDTCIELPCFVEPMHEPVWRPYDIVAVTTHQGMSPCCGHYCTSLWHEEQQQWFHYDDGTLPTIGKQNLSEWQCKHVVLIWIKSQQ